MVNRKGSECLLKITDYNLVKSKRETLRWLDKKFDIQGVGFLQVLDNTMWYVEDLQKTYNAGDRIYCDAITDGIRNKLAPVFSGVPLCSSQHFLLARYYRR